MTGQNNGSTAREQEKQNSLVASNAEGGDNKDKSSDVQPNRNHLQNESECPEYENALRIRG